MQSTHQPPQLESKLTDDSAILTFPHYEIDSSRNSHDRFRTGDQYDKNLQSIQNKTHPNIPAQNFVRQFQDHDKTNPMMHSYPYDEFDSAFASMTHAAFGKHQTIELRPDDIHLLILQGITRFIQTYPEDFRKNVVSFSGKKTLKVILPDSSGVKHWEEAPLGFAGLIRAMINNAELADVMLQDYSNSTDMDKKVKAVTMMGTFSVYFQYIEGTMCFIPQFILKGTVEDWHKLALLPEKLLQHFKLTAGDSFSQMNGTQLLHRWLSRLSPIVNQMYLSRKGEADSQFWLNFYKFQSESGGNTISGNIVHFYPFLKIKNYDEGSCALELNTYILDDQVTLGTVANKWGNVYGPDSSQLPANFVEVDFLFQDGNNHISYDMGMKAGMVAYKKDSNNILSPHMDFSIFYKNRIPKKVETSVAENETKEAKNDSVVQPSQPNLFAGKTKPSRTIKFELELNDDEPGAPSPSLTN